MTALPPASGFAVVVAADEAGGIGLAGELPWRLPPDLKRFRELTVGSGNNAVIMGRVTWDSLPAAFRPLPHRRNVVVSRRSGLAVPAGVVHAQSFDQALAASHDCAAVYVIGGGQLYALALRHPACQRVYLTRVVGDFHCDTHFPELGPEWHLESDQGSQHYEQLHYRFLTYHRCD